MVSLHLGPAVRHSQDANIKSTYVILAKLAFFPLKEDICANSICCKRTREQSHYHCRVHNYMNLPKYGKIVTNRGGLADILVSHLVFGITQCPV